MPSPYASPQASDVPVRSVWWVLRCAAALVAIAAWLVLLLHVLLLVRAEYRLERVLEDANRFSKLPEMSVAELSRYTHRHLSEQGLQDGKLRVASDYSVHQIEAKPAGGVLGWTERASGWLTRPTPLRSGGPPDAKWPFFDR